MLSLPLILAIQHANAATFTASDAAELQAAIDGAAPGASHTFNIAGTIVGGANFSRLTGAVEVVGGSWVGGIVTLGADTELQNVTSQGTRWECSGGSLEVQDGEFTDMSNDSALYLTNCDAVIAGAEFRDNILDSRFGTLNLRGSGGAAINAEGGSLHVGTASVSGSGPRTWDINGCEFDNNWGIYGGAIYAKDVDDLVIEGNDFVGNIANDLFNYSPFVEAVAGYVVDLGGRGAGGAVRVEGGGGTRALFRFNEITAGFAWEDAGASFEDVDNLVINNNNISQNWAVKYGGGLGVMYEEAQTLARPLINNNTFVGNTAGLSYVFETIMVVGGGGNVRIHGEIPEFKNNIVAHAYYGGGMLGVDDVGQFEQGDLYHDYVQYNMFYDNCDIYQCAANSAGDIPTTGNYAAYSLHPSNFVGENPNFIYLGDERQGVVDNDAYPDVLCTVYYSLAVRGGDPTLPNEGQTAKSDIGYCGGPEGDFINRDRDQDGFEQYYDCFDEPGLVNEAGGRAEDVFPGAAEVCDLQDNNCDGEIDEGFDNTWWPDLDEDGFGDDDEPPSYTCTPPGANFVSINGDCDDQRDDINPDRVELCNEIDDNCDGGTNGTYEGLSSLTVYRDIDGDGYGTDQTGVPGCEQSTGVFFPVSEAAGIPGEAADVLPIEGGVAFGGDCDNQNPDRFPTNLEICDGIDNDCTLVADDGPLGTPHYEDVDGDGYGDPASELFACEVPEGRVTNGTDCDESNVNVNPGAIEDCDGIDNDCNGLLDDDPPAQPVLYNDFDGDGYGNPATAVRVCNAPVGYVQVGGDCDDNDPTVGECSECGCQATPTPGSAGLMLVALTGLLGLRRRKA